MRVRVMGMKEEVFEIPQCQLRAFVDAHNKCKFYTGFDLDLEMALWGCKDGWENHVKCAKTRRTTGKTGKRHQKVKVT